MDDMPELWWSPEEGLIKHEGGLYWLLTNGPILGDSYTSLPADAVRLDRDRGTDYIRVGETVSTEDRSDTYRLISGPQRMYLEPVNTGQPHVIDIARHAWTMKHPVTCRAKLFQCSVHKAALKSEPLGDRIGRFVCTAGYDGFLVLGEETA